MNAMHETALSKVVSSNIMKQSVMLEVAHILLHRKAKVHFDNQYKESAMMTAACEKGNAELVRLMFPYDSWDDPDYTHQVLSEAVDNGHTKVVELLLTSEHIDIDHEELVSMLHQACNKKDDPEMIRIMLDKYPELVDHTSKDYHYKITALMQASLEDHTEVVKMLLECGAKIDIQVTGSDDDDNVFDGVTALMLAAMAGKSKTVKLLLEKGAALQKIKCITTMMCCFACTLSCKNNHSVVVPTTVDDNDKIWLYIPFYLNQLL